MHLWRKTQDKSYQKIEADNAGYFLLPEANIKIRAIQQRLTFVDAVTGEVLRDNKQFGKALKDAEQRTEDAKQRAENAEQRAEDAEQRAETAFEEGKQVGKQKALEDLDKALKDVEQRVETAFEEGKQAGEQAAKQAEKQENARKMLAEGIDPNRVVKITGLSHEELTTLSSTLI